MFYNPCWLKTEERQIIAYAPGQSKDKSHALRYEGAITLRPAEDTT
jgi:hypothetical protein